VISRRHALKEFCVVCGAMAAAAASRPIIAAETIEPTTLTPDEALARLTEGNRRYVADSPIQPDLTKHRRQELTAGQAPFASILGCADSRVPPEEIFNAGLGEVFTNRVAGNTISQPILGSIEYSVVHLGVPLVLVLGHEKCGAVTAAVDVSEHGTMLPGALMAMVDPILPAVAAVRGKPGDLLANAARENARRTAVQLRQDTASLSEPLQKGKLKVVAGYYSLDTGAVEIFT
jgi:carbonic anhydrase